MTELAKQRLRGMFRSFTFLWIKETSIRHDFEWRRPKCNELMLVIFADTRSLYLLLPELLRMHCVNPQTALLPVKLLLFFLRQSFIHTYLNQCPLLTCMWMNKSNSCPTFAWCDESQAKHLIQTLSATLFISLQSVDLALWYLMWSAPQRNKQWRKEGKFAF